METSNLTDGEPQVLFSQILPILQDLIGYVKRCGQVLVQLVQQMAAFYTYPWENPKIIATSDVHLQVTYKYVFHYILLKIHYININH